MLWLLSVTLIQLCHITKTQTPGEASLRQSRVSQHEHIEAGVSLTCQREARRCFVFDCHIPSCSCCYLYICPPLAHQVCFTFYLMNYSHEVILPLQQHSLKQVFFFFFFYTKVVMLTCFAPGLIFSLKAFLSNNEIKNLFLAQCHYRPQIKRIPM